MESGRLPRGADLRLALWRAARSVDDVDRESIADTALGSTDFAVLESLLAHGPRPTNWIARKVLVTSGSITAAIDRLERRGFVARSADPRDRRVVVVALTGEGEAVIRKAFTRHAAALDAVFAALDLDERRTLFRLLAKVRRSCAGSSCPKGGAA